MPNQAQNNADEVAADEGGREQETDNVELTPAAEKEKNECLGGE